MGATTRPLPAAAGHQPAGVPFIAADVGGTHVRVGLVCGDSPTQVEHYRKYACADFPSLAAVLEAYLAGLPASGPVRHGVIACAGHPLEDGSLLSVNLPWPVAPQRIRAQLGFDDLRLVNDFEAVAHAVAAAGAQSLLRLTGPDLAPPGPVLVVGPGTGLGAAVRIPAPGHAVVLATEAGQAALTVSTEAEIDVLREFLRDRRHVPIEHALSGPGLVRLHAALARVRGMQPGHATPDAITAAARSGDDPLARDTLELFCGLLGGAVGDMALLYGAHGGVYLAGGILPQIRDFLEHSSFVRRFLDKGPMREALLRIPVTLVDHGQLGVIGAAGWYLDQSQNDNE
ncbi:glucokinase [Luteimonas viscosa]|uniref:glucokinase n=1 Tax=Luteimonas viscosa TaxID=1132694 RepID=UPI0021CCB84F|nr:glucokinase [Luteimonas viscosa]